MKKSVCVCLALYMNYDYSREKNWNDCQKAKCVKGQLEFYDGVYNALLFNKKKESFTTAAHASHDT